MMTLVILLHQLHQVQKIVLECYMFQRQCKKIKIKKIFTFINAVKQIENKYKNQSLDIEFAIDKNLI